MKSKYLSIRQLVPPEIYDERGDRAWELIDEEFLVLLDLIWEKCGEYVINDWHEGGNYKESGGRSAGTSTGAKLSMHKFFRAGDLKPKKGTVREFHEKIRTMPGLGDFTMEDIESTPTWVHVDKRNNQIAGVRIVKP